MTAARPSPDVPSPPATAAAVPSPTAAPADAPGHATPPDGVAGSQPSAEDAPTGATTDGTTGRDAYGVWRHLCADGCNCRPV